ncbi:MAG: MlaD family protein [Vampirovibrionales bacterium]|nr:MlaD family protein [Vampirovibrionales bacterium]
MARLITFKTLIGWGTDAALWFAVIGVLALAMARYGPTGWLGGQRQQIVFYVSQASSVKPGTPVRLLGVDVGVVNDVQLQENNVRLAVRTAPGALAIPPGTRATVQFKGLAGGNSIDLIPPSPEPTAPEDRLLAKAELRDTIRLRDFFETQNDLAIALIEGTQATERVLSQSKTLANPRGALAKLNTALNHAENSTQLAAWRIQAAEGKLPGFFEQWRSVVNDLNDAARVASRIEPTEDLGPNVLALARYSQMALQEASPVLKRYHAVACSLNNKAHALQQNLPITGPRQNIVYVQNALNHLPQFNAVLAQIQSDLGPSSAFTPPQSSDALCRWQQHMDAFKSRLERMNAKF